MIGGVVITVVQSVGAQTSGAVVDPGGVKTVRDLVELGAQGMGGALGAAKVTLEVVDTPVRKVVRSLEVMLREHAALVYPNLPGELLRFEVFDDVQGSVTMCLHDVSLKTTLAALCESIGCVTAQRVDDHLTWVLAPVPRAGSRDLRPRPTPGRPNLERQVCIQANGAPFKEFLAPLLQIENLGLEVAASIASERVTIDYEGPLRGALDEVCEKAMCSWHVEGVIVDFKPR
jgi:hypothetical protein